MNSNENQCLIPLFDGSRYNHWKFRLETLLDEKDLLKFIEKSLVENLDGITDEVKKNEIKTEEKKCKTIIVRTLHDSQLEIIKEKKNAKDMWDALSSLYERKSVAGQLLLRRKLLTIRYNDSDGMSDHFVMFDGIIRDLRSAGANLEEMDIVCHLLLTMPRSFDNLVTAIETMDQDKLGVEFVKSRLLDEANKKGVGSSYSKSQNNSAMSVICYTCKKPGHKQSQCYYNKNKNNDGKNNGSNNDYKSKYYNKGGQKGNTKQAANNAKVDSEEESMICIVENKSVNVEHECLNVCSDSGYREIKFILDSGATEHMVNSKEFFQNLHKIDTVNIAVAKKDQKLQTSLQGDIHALTNKNDHTSRRIIRNILYVKQLNCNLLSTRSLVRKGYQVIFDGDRAYINKNGDTKITAHLNGRLYEVTLYKHAEQRSLIANEEKKCDKSQKLWHFRLAHLNVADMNKLLNCKMTDGIESVEINKDSDFCEPCVYAKQTKKPFPKVEEARSKRVLELIHSDVCGPAKTTAHDGSNYFVTFTDDFSRASMVYCINKKSEVIHKFMEYVAMAEALHSAKIAKIRVDNGGEYTSNDFKKYCLEK